MGTIRTRLAALAAACALAGAAAAQSPHAANPQAATPPPPGFALALTFGPAWTSNPDDLRLSRGGDVYLAADALLSYRRPLWEGGAITLSTLLGSEIYRRDAQAGFNRIAPSIALSQSAFGATITLTAIARSSLNQQFTTHDTASREIGLSITRPVPLTDTLTLVLNAGASRRFYGDGSEDDIRLRLGATLARKLGAFTLRLGGGFSWLIEDKTPILPRINDRTISASLSGSYEWRKDVDFSVRLAFFRAYSSLPANRYITWSVIPQGSVTYRF